MEWRELKKTKRSWQALSGCVSFWLFVTVFEVFVNIEQWMINRSTFWEKPEKLGPNVNEFKMDNQLYNLELPIPPSHSSSTTLTTSLIRLKNFRSPQLGSFHLDIVFYFHKFYNFAPPCFMTKSSSLRERTLTTFSFKKNQIGKYTFIIKEVNTFIHI